MCGLCFSTDRYSNLYAVCILWLNKIWHNPVQLISVNLNEPSSIKNWAESHRLYSANLLTFIQKSQGIPCGLLPGSSVQKIAISTTQKHWVKLGLAKIINIVEASIMLLSTFSVLIPEKLSFRLTENELPILLHLAFLVFSANQSKHLPDKLRVVFLWAFCKCTIYTT